MLPHFIRLLSVAILLLLGATSSFSQKPELIPQLGHTGSIGSAIFGLDGRILISKSSSGDRGTNIWDVTTGRLLRTLLDSTALAVSPDGKALLAIVNKRIVLLDLFTGDVLLPLTTRDVDENQISENDFVFSSDGRFLYRVGENLSAPDSDEIKGIQVWNLSNGASQFHALAPTYGYPDYEFSSDGKYLAATNTTHNEANRTYTTESIIVYDTRSIAVLYKLPLSGGEGTRAGAFFSRDNKALIVGTNNGATPATETSIYDAATGRELYKLQNVPFGKEESYFNSDIHLSAVVQRKKTGDKLESTIEVWDILNKKVKYRIELLDSDPENTTIGRVGFSLDGKTLVAAIGNYTHGDKIRLWEAASGKPLQTLAPKIGNNDLGYFAFSPDSRTLATWGPSTGRLSLWDVASGAELFSNLGYKTNIDSINFSPNNRFLAASGSYVRGDSTVRLWNLAAGSIVANLPGEFKTFTADSSIIITETHISKNTSDSQSNGNINQDAWKSEIVLWTVATATKLHTFPGGFIGISPDHKKLITNYEQNGIILWDVETNKAIRTLVRDTAQLKGKYSDVSFIVASPDFSYLAVGQNHGHTLELLSIETGEVKHSLPIFAASEEGENLKSISFSPDTGLIVCSWGMDWAPHKVKVWEVASGKVVNSFEVGGGFSVGAQFNRSGNVVVTAGNGVDFWNVRNGKAIRQLDVGSDVVETAEWSTGVTESPDGKVLAVHVYGGRTRSFLLATDTGKEIRWFREKALESTITAFSTDNRIIATLGEDDGIIRIWDFAAGTNLASLIALDAADWLVVTPDGLFDGTPTAWKKILWRFKKDIFDVSPVEAFFTEFFYPGLLADIMSGKKVEVGQNILQKDRRQPLVKLALVNEQSPPTHISSRNIAVKIEVSEAPADKEHKAGSGVRDVRLFRNGSLIQVWRGEIKLDNTGKSEFVANIAIIAGDNNLTAYAFNRDNIKSDDARLLLKGADSLKRVGTLYVLAIGINQYANAAFNLRYAVADATSLGNELPPRQKPLGQFAKIEVIPLLDKEATKGNILQALHAFHGEKFPNPKSAFKAILGNVLIVVGVLVFLSLVLIAKRTGLGKKASQGFAVAGASLLIAGIVLHWKNDTVPFMRQNALSPNVKVEPEDTIIIYFAGHGTAQRNHFYLIPHDLGYKGPRANDQILANLPTILAHSISDEDLSQAFEKIDAGRLLLIIDACNSGQALEAEEKRRGPLNSRGLAQLAYEKGMYILTASQSYQAAIEAEQLGHGFLTYALVNEGLKTKSADQLPGDGQITAREWLDYATQRVPQMQVARMQQGRLLQQDVAFVEGEENLTDIESRSVQQPKVYYRSELEAPPLVIARP